VRLISEAHVENWSVSCFSVIVCHMKIVERLFSYLKSAQPQSINPPDEPHPSASYHLPFRRFSREVCNFIKITCAEWFENLCLSNVSDGLFKSSRFYVRDIRKRELSHLVASSVKYPIATSNCPHGSMCWLGRKSPYWSSCSLLHWIWRSHISMPRW